MPRHTLTGNIQCHRQFPSRTLGNRRDILVYLPPGYLRFRRQQYPVLYLQDGQNVFDAATAFRMGLLSEVVPRGTALDRAREIARRLAQKSPIVMKIGRDAFMRAVDADFRRSVENAAESFALVATTEDCQEGLNAFVEKRTPSYKGR